MSAPRLPRHLVARPRLAGRLDAATPVTLLRAPIGFGKTTLVGQWAASRALTTAWVRVRPGHGSSADFWVSVVDALNDAGAPMPEDTLQRSPLSLAERMLAVPRRELVLVVDGFENVTAPEADQVLLDLVWNAPGVRLVVALRGYRHFANHLLADLDVTRIAARELLFTADETRALFAAMGLDISRATAEQVTADCGGWPEPIRAFALALGEGSADGKHLGCTAQATASAYLRERLLPRVSSADVTEFLLLSSLPDAFDAEVALALTDQPDVKAHLEMLEREGVLLPDLVEGATVYRWPAAVRAALRRELGQRFADRLPDLHARLAQWYVDHGAAREALTHAVASQRWPLVAEVVNGSWHELLYDDRDALYQALVAAPPDVLADNHRVRAVRHIVVGTPEGADAAADVLAPTGGPDTADEPVRESLSTGLAVLMALRRSGHFDRARHQAEQLLHRARAAGASESRAVADLLPSIELHAGATMLLAGDSRAVIEPLGRAWRRAADSSLPYVGADAAATLALAFAAAGDALEAQTWLHRRAQAAPAGGWLSRQAEVKVVAAQLFLAVDRAEWGLARQLRDMLRDQGDDSEFWAYPVLARLRYLLYTGTPAEGLELLDRTRLTYAGLLQHGAGVRPLLAAAEAELLLALGRANQARAVVHGPDAQHPALRVPQARLALLTGDVETAHQLAGDTGWSRLATPRQRLAMLLIRAVTSIRRSQPSLAIQALQQAVDVASRNGTVAVFASVPRSDLLAGAAAGDDSLAGEVAQRLAVAPREPFPSALAVVRLTDREQRVLEQLAAGRTTQQTADALVVSYNTVKTQQRSLYRKLGADSRRDAVARAREWGLLT